MAAAAGVACRHVGGFGGDRVALGSHSVALADLRAEHEGALAAILR
ncbi:MAG TPA: hypothetical protein VFR34_01040 [Paracoccaceae bacterium]|nr:hypothetical protein [Paracoccaceae bacterium]